MNWFRRCRDFVLRVWRLFSRHNIPRAAAAMTYFFLLSLFPLLLCVNAIVGRFDVDMTQLLSMLHRVLPHQAVDLVGEYFHYLSAVPSAALWIGIPTVLIASSAGLRVLLDTMSELYGHPRSTGVRRLAVSVLFSLLFLLTLCFAVIVVLTGDRPLQFVAELLARLLGDNSHVLIQVAAVSRLWAWLRYLLLFCFVAVLVLTVYRLGLPRRQAKAWSVTISAMVSALTMALVSGLFSRFIDLSANYSLLYGSLASIIVLLLWLYLCGTILLLGAVVNRAWTGKTV